MNKMILRNQQELSCPCGNTRKAKPIRQAKTRLLLILAALLFGGKAWGQFPTTWHNNDHITGINNLGIGGNITITIDNGATVYLDGQIAPINNAGQTFTVTIKVSGTNGTCTIMRGSNNTGALFNVYGSNNIYGSNFGAGKLDIQAGVTIDGGNIANCAPLIQVEEGGTCTLTKVTLKNNIAVQGAAIKNSGTLTATNCTIQNNAASGLGGGIFTTNSATLTSCTITGNTAGDGAGIYATNILSCTNCTLSSNSISNSDGSGGGIYYCGSNNTTDKLTINGCTINGNSAAYKGGGIIMHANGTTNCNGEIKGNTNIYDNSAKDAGGLALHDPNVACTLSAGTIYGNTASRNGGGVYISTNSTLTYSGGDIGKIDSGYENTATSNGGGVYIQGNLVMSAGNILNNSANQGGGVYVTATGTMTFDAGSIHDNTATSNGGGIYFNGNTFTMTGTTARSIYGNSAVNGGGVYVSGTFDASNAKLTIYSNSATNGGGIYSSGTLTLGGSLVGKSGGANTAERGAGVYTAGTLNIQGGNIQYNTMTGTAKLGAGVYIAGGTTTMSGGAINNNTTAIDGAGVYINGGTFTMSAGGTGEVYKNTATGNGGGVYVASGGTFNSNGLVGKSSNANTAERGAGVYTAGTLNIQGGNIQYNAMTGTAKLGAGVYIAGGTTTMSGGAINNNTTDVNGGGVYIDSNGSFTISNGAIYSNTAKGNTGIGTSGGGGIYNAGTFTMNGGEIYVNTASAGANSSGGGVCTTSTFNMSGGTIGKSGSLNKSRNGAGVCVGGGTFTMTGGDIIFNEASTTSNGSTTFYCGGGVYIASGTFKLQGGNVGKVVGTTSNLNKAKQGGGVYIGGGTFEFTSGEVQYNTATAEGGGVYFASGTFTMAANTSIHNNTATTNGGGIYLAASGFTLINNNSIYSNSAKNGGGIYVPTGVTFSMSGGEIYSNTATTSGGGVYVVGTDANTKGIFNMTGGTIGKDNSGTFFNKATNGAGVYVAAFGEFTMQNAEILGNTATSSGGGVYVIANGSFTMDNATIHHNTDSGTDCSGGGIFTSGSVSATGNTKIYNNNSTGTSSDGGGVAVGENGSFTMTNGEIYSNTTIDGGGGIHLVNKATSSVSLTGTKVYGNSAKHGAGIYKNANAVLSITGGEFYSNAATANGGAINIAGGTVTLTGVSIGKEDNNAYLPNTAKVGGGIYMAAGTVTIQKNSTKADTKSYIIGNNTITTGGGIHKEAGTLEISDTEIKDNTSTTAGGGLYSKAGATTITNTEISSNTSTTTGGGIHFAGGTLSITDSQIENNTAGTTGGGVYKGSPTITVKGLVVINDNHSGGSNINDNVNIVNAPSGSTYYEYLTIHADGLECGSCIGITKSHSYSSSTYTEIVKGAGTAPAPANNCGYAYRNRFFFDDTDTHTVTNSTTSPYYNGGATSLYFVKNANYNTAANPWLANANASGCTLDGNGFVTAVNNAAGMAYFAQHILAGNDYSGKTVSLTANIDLSGHNWEPIGYAAECLEGNGTIFNGTFDGQGHTITNVTSPFPYDNMGLFGVVGDNGVVKNTVVANINFTGTNTHTGAVAGLLNGSVYNCSAITVSNSSIGTTDASLVGEVGADGSLKNCFVNTSATIGLANENGGTIENCYMRGATSFVGGTGTGTVNYCYAPSGSVSGTNSVYGATDLTNSNKYGFAHSDQQITSNSDNTHIVNGAIDNHGELKGLLATLNHWVKTSGNGWNAGTQSNSNGYALWTRTMASPINGDYPVLMMPGTVCVGSPDGTLLDYAADINTLLEASAYSSAGDIYLYATNPTSLGGTSGTTRVYINEHVGVLQTANTTVNARVGVTLDNSSTGYMSYDWHMFSSALTAAPLGLEYHSGVNDNYLVKTNYSTYLSNGIPHTDYESAANMDPTKTTWNTTTGQIGYFPTNTPYGTWRGTPDPVGSFDFYCYHEPTCHWINFKREGTSSFYDHWRENEDPTTHTHLNIPYENESSLTPGKGYLVALSQPSMLMADGVLNNGDASGNVSINVTASDINFTGYEYTLKGINLIGNPFQSYLDFDEFASYSTNTQIGNTYYILDADKKGYVSYTVGQTNPPAPKMLHPHQGFYVKVPASQSLQFTPAMRATTGAVFRDDKPSYPLVNLVCTDGQGRNDFATVELDRPEAGGGEKVLGLHSGDASVWIHTDEADWQTAFTTPGLREVPVRFKAYKDGFFTISWNTMNADFNYMHLIDNLNGTDIDCLNADEYHFEGKVTDYSSRFRLVLEYTDVEENEDDASTGSATFAFMMGDELVVNSGSSASTETALLEMFDLNGRCLLSKELHGEQSTLHLPTTAPGIYVLRLTANRQTRTQKMVIR